MASLDRPARSDPDEVQVRIAGATLAVAVADDEAERRLGLAGRMRLGPGRGMLLEYSDVRPVAVWMKGMRFPIDLIWIRGNRVVGVGPRLQPPRAGTPDGLLQTYSSPWPANGVLEAPAGWVRRHGIAPGQRVRVGS